VKPYLFTDDVVALCKERHPNASTHEPRAIGPLMRACCGLGYFEPTQDWVESSQGQNHRPPCRVWRMNLTPVQLEAIVRADGRKHFAYLHGDGAREDARRPGRVQGAEAVRHRATSSSSSRRTRSSPAGRPRSRSTRIGLSYAIHQSGRAMVDTDVDVLIVNYEALLIDRVRLMIASFIDGQARLHRLRRVDQAQEPQGQDHQGGD
jgi:hypothetical protein